MDENLYDELGNYIGPELQEDSDEEVEEKEESEKSPLREAMVDF